MSVVDVLARLTPQMRAVLAKQDELADNAFATDVSPEQMRASYAAERLFWNEGGPVMAETVDTLVPGPAGDVPVRLHRPTSTPGLPCIVYVHGGGFVVGNLDTHDRIMRSLAEKTGAAVVGVDYSLSPEARFPLAVQECAAVAVYLRDNAGSLGIDGGHLSFAGDSGGANLSLAATLYLRDEVDGAPEVRSLLLYYGMFGLRDAPARRLFGGVWDGLTAEDLENYMVWYTTSPADLTSPYLDCLSADLSHGVPPSYVAASALDPLRDDSLALAEVLDAVSVPCRLSIFDGVLHGFLHHSRMLPEAVDALDEGAAFYRDLLAADSSASPRTP